MRKPRKGGHAQHVRRPVPMGYPEIAAASETKQSCSKPPQSVQDSEGLKTPKSKLGLLRSVMQNGIDHRCRFMPLLPNLLLR